MRNLTLYCCADNVLVQASQALHILPKCFKRKYGPASMAYLDLLH